MRSHCITRRSSPPVVPGQDLLIDDGRVRVRVTGIEAAAIEAEVITAGAISNRKGVNLPGTLLDVSPLTPKDRADLAFGLDLGVDWVALSFVQTPSDVIEARGLIGDRAGIMTKVEKPQALERIDDIIRLSDAVMVARGDLGVEIPHEDVPGRQKELIRACRLAGEARGGGDPNARFDGLGPDTDPRRGLGCGHRHLRRGGRGDAVGRIRHGAVPGRDGGDDGSHHP